MADNQNNKGDMTVGEAGQKGGRTVSNKYGHEHFQEIGKKGGERVHDLVEEGKQAEESDE